MASPTNICRQRAAGEPWQRREMMRGRSCSAPPRTLRPKVPSTRCKVTSRFCKFYTKLNTFTFHHHSCNPILRGESGTKKFTFSTPRLRLLKKRLTCVKESFECKKFLNYGEESWMEYCIIL
jgi:hypothetical protein